MSELKGSFRPLVLVLCVRSFSALPGFCSVIAADEEEA